MAPLVKFALALLRAASHAALFLELQRLALHLARPTSVAHLAALESALLATVKTPISHVFLPTPLPMHALIAGADVAHGSGAENGDIMDTDAVEADRGHAQRACSSTSVVMTMSVTDTATAAAGPATAPPLVLLHGHSMSAAFFFRNIDDLVSLGYRVYAVDLLGWGRSARPHFSGSTPDDTLDWYLASFAAWVDAMNIQYFTLLGHSLGAYLAFEYAKRCPNRVRRLIMISPAAISRNMPFVRACYFALPPQSVVRRGGLLGFLLFMLYYPRDPSYIRDRLRDYTYHLAAQQPPSGEVAIIPIIRFEGISEASVTRPLVEALDYMPIPVLLVCGETDASININDVHMLYHEMKRKGFNVRLAVVEGTDHCPHLEAPEAFFDAIAEFAKAPKSFEHIDNLKFPRPAFPSRQAERSY